MFGLIILLITVGTAAIPWLVRQFSKYFSSRKLHSASAWLPLLAGFLFFIAFFLSDIHISDQTDTFQQHFVGGGMYAAILYVYFKQLFGWKLSRISTILLFFAWVSAFGVASELLEFALTKVHLVAIDTGDTDWDLLANTSGALAAYVLLFLARVEQPSKH